MRTNVDANIHRNIRKRFFMLLSLTRLRISLTESEPI